MKKTHCGNHQPNGLQFLLLALFIVLIGSSTTAYGQDVSTSFEFNDTSGSFTLGTSPKSVTFTNGLAQTVNNSSLYRTGSNSFMVETSNTATITFETPAASVTLWLRDQFSGNPSVLKVFDQNSQVISTFNATTSFVQVNLSPECGNVKFMTLQNNGTGFAVIDDFSFTAGQVGQSTVLIASFMNGNDDELSSRVYLWNPSESSGGEVCVRVFPMPLMNGTAQELTPASLSLGTLAPKSALNIKVAEDILDPLGRRPYKDIGGNLTLEFTIQTAGVRGSGQVFDKAASSIAFGTYPLQEIPATTAGSPTVLVANILNGNDDVFTSRVYLYNPSDGDGAVTVRVFTLPLINGLTQELTTAPLPLGNLASKSALNIKVAEDILDPLGRRPYKDIGGNLTLEFTIQAADVVGAAQFFSSLAFGTYPLQVIQ